jgi:hypothetical protein
MTRPATAAWVQYGRDLDVRKCELALVAVDAEVERLRALAADYAALNTRCNSVVDRLSGAQDKIERLLAALKGIAEYCSGDGRPLGAIERLAAIQNTANQAVRHYEQDVNR